ncbi:MAG: hypothetical protein A2284_08050 [Deltaproteobacteria bacterium RIFOXYA12_FULL_61_11]|nr:MAG: hypothetical protein A2284_08050 [Deltaproteobacteria bacterium RIFOXYA12_FULL_61_11]
MRLHNEVVMPYTNNERMVKMAEGGMGEIFLRHGPDNHRSVVKRLRPETSPASSFLLQKEALLVSLLDHPNLVTYRSFTIEDGNPVLELEYIDGVPLKEFFLLHEQKDLAVPLTHLACIGRQVLAAITYLHYFSIGNRPCHIAHRDLSPHNILLDRTGRATVIDLGISTLDLGQREDTFVPHAGKDLYSPIFSRRARGPACDVDLYSLGVILLEGCLGLEHCRVLERLGLLCDRGRLRRHLTEDTPVNKRLIDIILPLLFTEAPGKRAYRQLEHRLEALGGSEEGLAEYLVERGLFQPRPVSPLLPTRQVTVFNLS